MYSVVAVGFVFADIPVKTIGNDMAVSKALYDVRTVVTHIELPQPYCKYPDG